jgi:hypothetical protein
VERHELGIEAFELFDGERRIVSLKAAQPEDISYPSGIFRAAFGTDPTEEEVRVQIVGLFPTEIAEHDEVSSQIRQRRDMFEKAFTSPSYLGPFRSEEGSLPRIPHQGVRHLGPRGERALDILGDDGLRGDGKLVCNGPRKLDTKMGFS